MIVGVVIGINELAPPIWPALTRSPLDQVMPPQPLHPLAAATGGHQVKCTAAAIGLVVEPDAPLPVQTAGAVRPPAQFLRGLLRRFAPNDTGDRLAQCGP